MKIPKKLKNMESNMMKESLINLNNIKYVLYFPTNRFPEEGWLNGSLANIAGVIQFMSSPKYLLDKCVDIMLKSIEKNTIIINNSNKGSQQKIAHYLRQDINQETWKMANLVIQNAMLFYDSLSGMNGIDTIQELKTFRKLNPNKVINAWNYVLTKDYAPIFKIAVKILSSLNNHEISQILQNIDEATNKIITLNMTQSGDMFGMLFQRLVEDRKQLAAFYTLPESAALLSTIITPNELDPLWKNKSQIMQFRIADFACGTGMLLTSIYKKMITNYGISGKNMIDIHAHMIENNIIGYDVLPIATHITAASLAGIFPKEYFDNTRIMHVELGKYKDDNDNDVGGYSLGSLNLIEHSSAFTDQGTAISGTGEKKIKEIGVKDQSCDIVAMNPPFTRNPRTGIASDEGIIIPAFGAFNTSTHDQLEMNKLRKKWFKTTCGHGHAGLASYFIAIADRKLKNEGSLGLIVPSTITSGVSWKKVRNLLSTKYKDIILISLSQKIKKGDNAFSADTTMSEVMIIAKKRKPSEYTQQFQTRIKNVSLNKRPDNVMESLIIGDLITHTKKIQTLESGVYGGTELCIGDTKIGEIIDCPFDHTCNYNNVSDLILLQFAYKLTQGFLHIPKEFANTIDMAVLGDFAKMGADHQLFVGNQHNAPFTKSINMENPLYPALWTNNAKTQISLIVQPNLSLMPKPNSDINKITTLWKSASHVHYNDFLSFGSQKLSALYTIKESIGGTSIPSILFYNLKYEKAFTIWANSTLGIICHWFLGGRQQIGRSIINLNDTLNLPVLDFSKLSKNQLLKFDALFTKYSKQTLKPIKDLHDDKNRIRLDDEILNILEIEANLDDIRKRFAAEPHINGGNT